MQMLQKAINVTFEPVRNAGTHLGVAVKLIKAKSLVR